MNLDGVNTREKGFGMPQFDVNQRIKEIKRQIEKIKAVVVFDQSVPKIQEIIKNNKNMQGKKPEDVILAGINSIKEISKQYKTNNAEVVSEVGKDLIKIVLEKNLEEEKVIKALLGKDAWNRLLNGNFRDIVALEDWARSYKSFKEHKCTVRELLTYKGNLEDKLKDYEIYQNPTNYLNVNGVTIKFMKKDFGYEELDYECEKIIDHIFKRKGKKYEELKKNYIWRHGSRPKSSFFQKATNSVINLFIEKLLPEEQWDENFMNDAIISLKFAYTENRRRYSKAKTTYEYDKAKFEERFFEKILYSQKQPVDVIVKEVPDVEKEQVEENKRKYPSRLDRINYEGTQVVIDPAMFLPVMPIDKLPNAKKRNMDELSK